MIKFLNHTNNTGKDGDDGRYNADEKRNNRDLEAYIPEKKRLLGKQPWNDIRKEQQKTPENLQC